MSVAEPIRNTIERVALEKGRYAPAAYEFLLQGLEYTLEQVGERRHVSGQELLDGVRRLALESYGPLAKTVFSYWGVTRTDDFGEIVFDLIDAGILSKRTEDRKEDFTDVFDFEREFEVNYWRDLDRSHQEWSSCSD
ncbi:hypothetical protein AMJ39_02200 [candidate division TA06 bacterium DG_24]|jgi:uncharacterized repeat protein (TIGR04138 family)|uniref:Uncharacterized protein n=3 Tax=Bacteria division TA06 TaxID=1156500 RepID=A0A0S8JKX4_UNCT6|nr:MAG: hypothetical protein AMJ39_02200 [candidate division TA06 bacterium DG_24]KPK69458.1 MAG: hypothetical protein AMJ82_05530 [candidate division TA06 bacterium SM23_40]KPL10296.1 MAG: hypothetical protein AMJ71_03635 [candidate division TA06 bacterium SM1_40]